MHPVAHTPMRRVAHRAAAAVALFAIAVGSAGGAPAALATAPVLSSGGGEVSGFDGVVQAVRQTAVAAQVAGAVVALDVKAGDTVKAGQVLAAARCPRGRADRGRRRGAGAGRACRAGSGDARTSSVRSSCSRRSSSAKAALDRAESQYKASQAEAAAQLASAGAARTQSGFYVVKAPYDGVVSDVAVVLGDMAMPGRALLTVYDPRSLRVSVAVPQTVAARLKAGMLDPGRTARHAGRPQSRR